MSATGEELNEHGIKESSKYCKGTVQAPSAEPGNLCVYQFLARGVEEAEGIAKPEIVNPSEFHGFGLKYGAATTGASLKFATEGESNAFGTWAVTAE